MAFEQQKVTKHYLVVVRAVHGTSPPKAGAVGRIERHLSTDRNGRVHVDWPTSRHVKHRHAVLGWQSLAAERGARHALLAVALRGGFKHQIRALLGAEGLPVLGDVLYGGEPFPSHPDLIALHAATLQCAHPIHGYACAPPRAAHLGRAPAHTRTRARARNVRVGVSC